MMMIANGFGTSTGPGVDGKNVLKWTFKKWIGWH